MQAVCLDKFQVVFHVHIFKTLKTFIFRKKTIKSQWFTKHEPRSLQYLSLVFCAFAINSLFSFSFSVFFNYSTLLSLISIFILSSFIFLFSCFFLLIFLIIILMCVCFFFSFLISLSFLLDFFFGFFFLSRFRHYCYSFPCVFLYSDSPFPSLPPFLLSSYPVGIHISGKVLIKCRGFL